MESFLKTLQELRDLLKASKPKAPVAPKQMHPELPKVPEIKPIPAPSNSASANPQGQKMPGISPGSKKDPVKVAQQIKQGKSQKQAMPLLKIDHNGQWSLDKDEKHPYGKVTVIPDPPVKPGKVTVVPDKPVKPGKVTVIPNSPKRKY